MATKNYHRVILSSGFAIYRASPKTYVSYNVEKDSFSSKMLPGNVAVEIVPAPKVIKVKGEAWGAKVTRTYLEGERPVTHVLAFKGRGERTNWERAKAATGKDSFSSEELAPFNDPADPNYVSFSNYAATEVQRKSNEEYVATIRESIAKKAAGKLGKYDSSWECNEVVIVELR